MSTNTLPLRELGRSGLKVSSIGFGCMGMSCLLGDRSNLTEKQCVEVIHEAFHLGINFFDTAECYGPCTNETLLGKAISTLPREKLVIATKFGLRGAADGSIELDARPETIRKDVDGSLQRLGVTYIDLYYLHRVDPKVPIEDVARTMAELIKVGKVRHWGLSEAAATTIRKAHAICPLTAVQSEYSIIHRLPEQKIFPVLEELGIGFVPFGPLGEGFLTTTMPTDGKFAKDDIRGTMPRFTSENQKRNAPVLELVKECAAKKKATPAQIALAWVIGQRPYISPIPGTTKLHRLQENAGAASVHFTDEEMKEFNKRLSSIPFHGARYDEATMSMVEDPDDIVN